MENEIELLNQTETALLRLMAQYQSGQYVTLGECIYNVRAVRETLRHLTRRGADSSNCPRCGAEQGSCFVWCPEHSY
jgi:hypothetical protein